MIPWWPIVWLFLKDTGLKDTGLEYIIKDTTLWNAWKYTNQRKNGDLVDSDSKPNYFILTVRLFAFSIKAFHQLLYYYRTHSNINQRQSTFLNCLFTLAYSYIRH